MSCCAEAATYVIKALGGEEETKRVVGGTKWWQVRGVQGVDAEWIVAKKDWQEAKRRYKAQQKQASSDSQTAPDLEEKPACYRPDMDEMPCILYAHGGGYYFGSIDQERYGIQRFARKINGRVFTVNYRLAPQYPFPCAIQDLLAAYLFLIRPPPGASHQPVNPARIVFAGDSAGGGLTVALLQVLRDTGLPQPAGAFLISPWVDMTHSFPSIHLNTATDVIPQYGLSLYKPSTLWPPPSEELGEKVREKLRTRITQAVHVGSRDKTKEALNNEKFLSSDGASRDPTVDAVRRPSNDLFDNQVPLPDTESTLHLGSTATMPTDPTARNQTISMQTVAGDVVTIQEQIHFYTPNYMLNHPLVSPVVGYLGGLPPLLVIASDKEVLRDEVIYFAHKAAHPEQFTIKEEAKNLYPVLHGIESRYGPTEVHLQVYDDAAHILPILFPFTTPAKFCYRAIATFCKFATGKLPPVPSSILDTKSVTTSPLETPNMSSVALTDTDSLPPPSLARANSAPSIREAAAHRESATDSQPDVKNANHQRRSMTRRVFSAREVLRRGSARVKNMHSRDSSSQDPTDRCESADVAGPRFHSIESPAGDAKFRHAGEPNVYNNGLTDMIRERVSTQGVIRPLEPEDQLTAFQLPAEMIGVVSELAIRRYLTGKAKFDKKFAGTAKSIARKRKQNLELAQKDTMRNMSQLQMFFARDDQTDGDSVGGSGHNTANGIKEGLMASGSWSWAWALDMDEKPPSSSIVARRDTHEAIRLARIADQTVMMEESTLSANNLWQLMVNFLTVTPDKQQQGQRKSSGGANESHRQDTYRSRFARFVREERKVHDTEKPIN